MNKPVLDATQFAPHLSDRQLITNLYKSTLQFTLDHIRPLRAANAMHDPQSFEFVVAARSFTADWFGDLLKTSTYDQKELRKRCKFILRVAMAMFRDTLLSGQATAENQDDYLETHRSEFTSLINDLTDMTVAYLAIDG